MKKLIQLYVFFQVSCISFCQVKVTHLLCENLSNPIGLDVSQPRFGWQLTADKRNLMQTGYEIRVAKDASSFSKK